MKFKRNDDGTASDDSWVIRVVGDTAYIHDSEGDISIVCAATDVDTVLAEYR